MEGIELPNQTSIGTLKKKENYKYLVIHEADTIKQREEKFPQKNEETS